MIRRFFCALAALMFLFAPARAEENIGPAAAELVRLHVVADSDDPCAQRLKLRVRDCVLEEAGRILENCESAEEAFLLLEDNLSALAAAAQARAAEDGFSGPVTAQAGVFYFPDRDYGGVTVPAGNYRAVRVVLGSGEGRNWWCVLYPTLCKPEDVQFRSVLAQWFEKWFGGMEE